MYGAGGVDEEAPSSLGSYGRGGAAPLPLRSAAQHQL